MKAKEKADELVDVYYQLVDYPTPHWKNLSKQCALIAIDEVLSIITNSNDYYIMSNYYQQVKKEIENL
jgi:hypothetical protein